MREEILQNRIRWILSFFLFLIIELRKQRLGSPILSRKPKVWNSKQDANFVSFPHIHFPFPYPKDVWRQVPCFRLDFFCYMHERDGQMIPLGEISQVQLDSLNANFYHQTWTDLLSIITWNRWVQFRSNITQGFLRAPPQFVIISRFLETQRKAWF